MAFKPMLDVELALCCMRFTLPGNWHLLDASKTWKDFEVGRVGATRIIRHRGKKYWVRVSMNEIDGFAKLVAFGLLASPKAEYNAHFTMYSSDPRQGTSELAVNLGGVGVITRINDALRGH